MILGPAMQERNARREIGDGSPGSRVSRCQAGGVKCMSASERVCVIEESIIDAVLGLVLSPLVEFVESGSCPWSSSFTNKSVWEPVSVQIILFLASLPFE